MSDKQNLNQLISQALINAKENDYDFKHSTLNDIALDLLNHDADIEQFTYDEVFKSLGDRLRGDIDRIKELQRLLNGELLHRKQEAIRYAELEKQLAESVPKSEIKKLMVEHDVAVSHYDLEKLLTPPAKEAK